MNTPHKHVPQDGNTAADSLLDERQNSEDMRILELQEQIQKERKEKAELDDELQNVRRELSQVQSQHRVIHSHLLQNLQRSNKRISELTQENVKLQRDLTVSRTQLEENSRANLELRLKLEEKIQGVSNIHNVLQNEMGTRNKLVTQLREDLLKGRREPVLDRQKKDISEELKQKISRLKQKFKLQQEKRYNEEFTAHLSEKTESLSDELMDHPEEEDQEAGKSLQNENHLLLKEIDTKNEMIARLQKDLSNSQKEVEELIKDKTAQNILQQKEREDYNKFIKLNEKQVQSVRDELRVEQQRSICLQEALEKSERARDELRNDKNLLCEDKKELDMIESLMDQPEAEEHMFDQELTIEARRVQELLNENHLLRKEMDSKNEVIAQLQKDLSSSQKELEDTEAEQRERVRKLRVIVREASGGATTSCTQAQQTDEGDESGASDSQTIPGGE